MFRKIGLLAVLGTFLAACSSEERPSGILETKQMVPILKKLHLYEARLNLSVPLSDSTKYLFARYQDSLLKANGITWAQFDSSFAYYKRNTILMDEVYEATVDSLGLSQSTGQ